VSIKDVAILLGYAVLFVAAAAIVQRWVNAQSES
jgi:hypothetical protein